MSPHIRDLKIGDHFLVTDPQAPAILRTKPHHVQAFVDDLRRARVFDGERSTYELSPLIEVVIVPNGNGA